MTCEWAEGNLSAYLDDALDPQTRQDVSAHLETCARCQASLEELRRNDHLVAALTPIQPTNQLRERIFASPDYAALLREQGEATSASGEPADPQTESQRVAARRMSLYLRTLVPLAALLVISLGAALLFRSGKLPFGVQTAGQKQTTTIGGPGAFGVPLSAGPRLVYLSGGALWSVAEYAPNGPQGAPGAPQQLTAAGMQVAAWQVSPLAGSAGGERIAYVDGRTGALHIVHSDGQADTIIGALTPTQSPGAALWASPAGRAALASLTWSPDGAHLAYVTVTNAGGAQVYSYSLTSASNVQIGATHGAPITQLAWSADGNQLAFVGASANGAQTVTIWRGAGQALRAVAASPDDPTASVGQLAWSGATLSWTTQRDGGADGVFTLPAHASAASQLTPAGASYSAVGFTPARGGVWLLAGDGALSEAGLASGATTQVATLDSAANAIVWSPNGSAAALTLGGRLALWSDGAGLTTLAQSVSAQPTPVWSPDGSALVAALGPVVTVYRAGANVAIQVAQIAEGATMQALAWASDGHNIALAESHGLLLAPSNGSGATLLSSHPADGGALSWSVAG